MEWAAIASQVQGHVCRWGLRLVSVPLMTAGMAVGINCAYSPVGLAPEIHLSSSSSQLKGFFPTSLDALYELRDRHAAITPPPSSAVTFASFGPGSPGQEAQSSSIDLPPLHALNARIHVEEMAYYHWTTAEKLARRARQIERQRPLTVARMEESDAVWSAAIQQLESIPADSFMGQQVADTVAEYQSRRAHLAYRYDTRRSGFLRLIVEAAGIHGDQAHITVCHLESVDETLPVGDCRRLNGDRPPASPASLIKVPIAVATMQKIADSPIDLSTKIHVATHNYTEDASDILVGTHYSLRRMVARMINQSSNIATNQLIDSLGSDYINDVLGDRGYQDITIGHKLAGDRIFPDQFGERGTNRITTDELTAMMADIYLQRRPGDAVLQGMLATQTDERMGKAALDREGVEWLGEKTGWNSKVLGTTLAAVIGGDRYIITVALNHPSSTTAMQAIVGGIADHILDQDGF